MTAPTPPRGTVTTLRAPQKALMLGKGGADGATHRERLIEQAYLAYVVEDATVALARLRREKFVLLVVDADLPGGAATGFLEAVRADPQLADLPALVVSAADDVAAVERCLAAGADDCLPRRYGPAILQARLGAALDRRRMQDNQAMRREMSMARSIQRDFLPETLPQFQGLQLDAALNPARQVSGDFFDAFRLAPSGHLMLVLGDVCDKGVGAALFMALFRSLIRASADPDGGGALNVTGAHRVVTTGGPEPVTPAELLVRVAAFTSNYIARVHGRTNMFATAFLAVVNPRDGRFTYLNAGHEPALVVGPGGLAGELRPTGPALGMMPDLTFAAAEGSLEPGQTLFAFTDGLAEARSPAGEAFGAERLRGVVRTAGAAGASALVHGVVDSVTAFGQQAEPHDDLTMIAVTRL
ncbi:MAG: SpoIIE family protein phosphatase [Gemmatimonadota bacterium]|nr:SpoIIE family protein phosphatase [Gemmatimonadota bacterium]